MGLFICSFWKHTLGRKQVLSNIIREAMKWMQYLYILMAWWELNHAEGCDNPFIYHKGKTLGPMQNSSHVDSFKAYQEFLVVCSFYLFLICFGLMSLLLMESSYYTLSVEPAPEKSKQKHMKLSPRIFAFDGKFCYYLKSLSLRYK